MDGLKSPNHRPRPTWFICIQTTHLLTYLLTFDMKSPQFIHSFDDIVVDVEVNKFVSFHILLHRYRDVARPNEPDRSSRVSIKGRRFTLFCSRFFQSVRLSNEAQTSKTSPNTRRLQASKGVWDNYLMISPDFSIKRHFNSYLSFDIWFQGI